MIGTRHLAFLLIDGRLWEHGELMARYIYEYPKALGFYSAIVFGSYTKIYFDTYQKEQIHTSKLNEQLLTAQIGVLRKQLQPHLLFNTLNLISSTMYQDVDKADSIIMRLGNLLRYSLATEQKPWVSFNREMQAMTSFLYIAKLRFADRLSTKIEVKTQVDSVMIPAMLLQPLLENAAKYGIEPSDELGEIT
jgi:LytS/YehU family sensor histidine kinase